MALRFVLRSSPGRQWPEDREPAKLHTFEAAGSFIPRKEWKELELTLHNWQASVRLTGRAMRLLLSNCTAHVLIGRVLYEIQLRQGNSSASLVAQKRGVTPRPRAVPLPSEAA